MARLIDERPEDVEEKDTNNPEVEQEPQVEEETLEEPETDLPEKYQGKSTAEIVRMHQEAEKLLGKQSSEVGELRKVVDDYIQTQLSTQETQATQADEEIDFFSDPDKAVERAINNHPKIKEAEQISNQYRQSTAMNKLQTKHPDMQEILRVLKPGGKLVCIDYLVGLASYFAHGLIVFAAPSLEDWPVLLDRCGYTHIRFHPVDDLLVVQAEKRAGQGDANPH